jgi:hypothetical protein
MIAGNRHTVLKIKLVFTTTVDAGIQIEVSLESQLAVFTESEHGSPGYVPIMTIEIGNVRIHRIGWPYPGR